MKFFLLLAPTALVLTTALALSSALTQDHNKAWRSSEFVNPLGTGQSGDPLSSSGQDLHVLRPSVKIHVRTSHAARSYSQQVSEPQTQPEISLHQSLPTASTSTLIDNPQAVVIDHAGDAFPELASVLDQPSGGRAWVTSAGEPPPGAQTWVSSVTNITHEQQDTGEVTNDTHVVIVKESQQIVTSNFTDDRFAGPHPLWYYMNRTAAATGVTASATTNATANVSNQTGLRPSALKNEGKHQNRNQNKSRTSPSTEKTKPVRAPVHPDPVEEAAAKRRSRAEADHRHYGWADTTTTLPRGVEINQSNVTVTNTTNMTNATNANSANKRQTQSNWTFGLHWPSGNWSFPRFPNWTDGGNWSGPDWPSMPGMPHMPHLNITWHMGTWFNFSNWTSESGSPTPAPVYLSPSPTPEEPMTTPLPYARPFSLPDP